MVDSSFERLKGVQRTMVIPLWARAVETELPDAIIRDPHARQILNQLSFDTSEFEKERGLLALVPVVAAHVFDGFVRDFLARHPDGTIVEIGAGLDTRFERLDNGRAHWIDIDLPDAMEVRRQFFSESDRRRFIASSILDPAWVLQVQSRDPEHILFVAEGVLLYFKEEDVKALFQMIADHFPGAWLLCDSCVRGAAKNSHKFRVCQAGGAHFQWGIDDIHEVEKWDPRFHVERVDSVLNHFRHRYPWLVRFATWLIPGLRRIFTINLIRLGSSTHEDASR